MLNLKKRLIQTTLISTVLMVSNSTTTWAEVELIAPGLISTSQGEHSPTFDASRNELVFMRRTPGQFDYTLYTSTLINGAWTEPEILPFSGNFRDGGAAFSPNGNVLLYDSKRPIPGSDDDSINLWQVKRAENGWHEPQPLTALSKNHTSESKSGRDEFGPTMTTDGYIFFYSFRQPNRAGSHYRGMPGENPLPQPDLPDPSAATFVGYLTLSLDGRTAVIEGRSQTGTDTDLFYACLDQGKWSAAAPLTAANSPAGDRTPNLSSDGQWLWFVSDRLQRDITVEGSSIYRINTKELPIPCD